MSSYLLIESRDPFESRDSVEFFALAIELVRSGHEVTLFLLQNGVFVARSSVDWHPIEMAGDAGVQILADEFSLKERGIVEVRSHVLQAPLEIVVDQLAAGAKAIWH